MFSKNELLKLRRSEILLFSLLKERAVNNEVTIGRTEISEEINYSKAMVTKAMRTLEELGYIETESGLGSIITKFTILKEEE